MYTGDNRGKKDTDKRRRRSSYHDIKRFPTKKSGKPSHVHTQVLHKKPLVSEMANPGCTYTRRGNWSTSISRRYGETCITFVTRRRRRRQISGDVPSFFPRFVVESRVAEVEVDGATYAARVETFAELAVPTADHKKKRRRLEERKDKTERRLGRLEPFVMLFARKSTKTTTKKERKKNATNHRPLRHTPSDKEELDQSRHRPAPCTPAMHVQDLHSHMQICPGRRRVCLLSRGADVSSA